MEPHQDTEQQGKGHPAADGGTKEGERAEDTKGKEVPVVHEEAFGFKETLHGDGEGGQGKGCKRGSRKEDDAHDARKAGFRENEEGAEGIEKVELEFEAEGPGRAHDVAESEEVLEVEEMGGQLGARWLRQVVGGKEDFSQRGRSNPEEHHGDIGREEADVAAHGESQCKAWGKPVADQREGDDETGDDKENLDAQIPLPRGAVEEGRKRLREKGLEWRVVGEMGQHHPQNGNATEAINETKAFTGSSRGSGGHGVFTPSAVRRGILRLRRCG